MTSTLTTPSGRRGTLPLDVDLLRTGALAATGVAARGLAVLLTLCAVVWWAEDRAGSGLLDVARSAAQLWLAGHGTWLSLPSGRLGLVPLGLTVLLVLACRRAGRTIGAEAPDSPWRATAAVALPYAVLCALIALLAAGPALRPVPVTAAVGGLAVAATGAALGSGALRSLAARIPRRAQDAAVAGSAAALTLLGAGALLVALGLVLDAGVATDLARATEPGAVGGLGLVLLGAALAPNAAVAGAAWLAGPGFAVGTGTSVTPFGTELGAVPGLPLLAALPGGPPPSWAVVALVVPLVAGAVAGRLLLRRAAPQRLGAALADCARAGAAAGILLAAAAGVARGPLGGGHLADVGASPVRVGLAVAAEVAVGAAVVVVLARRRHS
ncbi:MAG: DUF6350 family protein [Actinomycetes bacterium]